MLVILGTIIAVVTALPTFLFCVTFARLFTVPRELLILSAFAFVFCLPAAAFAVVAILEANAPPQHQGNSGIMGLVTIGFPAIMVAFVLYLIVRTRLRDDWWNDVIAFIVAVISVFYLPDMLGLS